MSRSYNTSPLETCLKIEGAGLLYFTDAVGGYGRKSRKAKSSS
jgi:hypothetical protein